ncbi:FG-GAP-like repeat-containing protein [Simplicispira psychrophila]|uniref:FG-GAP-like repeat-containing protein n=1 Tax=Simplicispira psychrophila TaxID=80882 RepID=UPI0012EB2040|nr:FG-GAP-like repeat-containing protein [Simplicispira psychrophila]
MTNPTITFPINLSFAAKANYATDAGPRSITSADVNGDGKADLIVVNGVSDTVSVLINNGTGTFAAKTDYATGSVPSSVTSADVNGDSKADLIVANYGSSKVSVLTGSGDGTFTGKTDYATGLYPYSVTSADVNGDSKADLIVANYYGDTVSVLKGNGDGTFAAKTDYATGTEPHSVTSVDVNGDGKADLIVANGVSNTVSVLINNGTGTFATKTDYATGNAPYSVTSGDVNGDGKADLIVANSSSNTVSVLINNGTGTFAAKTDYATGKSPYSVTSADVNGDSKADLIVANYGSNTLSVLMNTSGPIATAFTEQTAIAASSSILISDADGDADWEGGSLKVQITANNEAADSLRLPTANPGGSAIWLDTSDNKVMAGTTQIGVADTAFVDNGAVWTLTFNTSATNALVQASAQAVQFNNSSDTPGTGARTVTFTATDKNLGAVSGNQIITVTAVNDAPTGLPTFTGTAAQGQTLTASTSGISDVDNATPTSLGTVSYQWQVSSNGLNNWVNIATSATSSTFALTALETSKYVRVKISYIDDGSTIETLYSAASAQITNGPSVSSIVLANAAAADTNAASVSYTVTFNESVTGVDASDFALTAGGTAAGTIASVTGSGTTYTVTANTVSGDGTLRLDLNSSDTGIVNGSSVAITSGFTAGQSYTVDHTAPTITIGSIALSADTGTISSDFITKTASQTITATLSGAPAGTDIVWGSVDGGTNWIDITNKVTGTALSWDGVTLTGSSTLQLKVTDAAGNDGAVASQAYALDTTAPILTSSSPADDATGVSIANNLTLTFSEALASNSGVIELHKSSDGSLVESFTLSSSNVAGAVVTLNPAADLAYSTGYYLKTSVVAPSLPNIAYGQSPNQNIKDLAGNAYAGISDAITLNFTTAAPETPGGGDGGGDTGGGSTSGGDDQDGVDASVEDSVPGLQPTNGGTAVAGDGNGDGIKDSDQAAVTSLTFLKTDTSVSNPGNAPKVFVTLVADAKDGQVNAGSKAVITSIAQKDAPANLPEGAKLPLGLFDFTAKAAAPGSTENFSIFIDGDITVNGYWKEVHSGASAGTWVNLADAAYGGKIVTEQGKTRLDFSIQDGGIFDDDGKADGTISDPGGPGFMVQAAAPTCPFDPFRIDADKDGMTDAVELLRGSSSAVKNNDVFSHNDLFVDQLYRDFLGREGYGDAGSAYWLNAMTTGVMSRADVLTSVLSSPEFDSHAGAVIRLYHAALGRSPELCGYNYWLGQANAGVNTSEMGRNFLASAEFATQQAGLDNAGFVDLMYHNVLQRAPEAAGRAFWLDQLQTGKTDRGGMLYSVVQSQEFKAAMVDDVAVDILYLGLLNRTASSAETAYWMGQYNKYADPTAFLQAASAATTEYHDRLMPADGSTHAAVLVGVLDEQAAG